MSLPGCPLGSDIQPPGTGIFEFGWTSVSVQRAGVGCFRALLYYPATVAGRDAPVDTSRGPYPAVTFGHGWMANPLEYRSTFECLAAQGYIVIAAASETEFFPSHVQLAEDMRQCLTYLEQENARPASWLYGLVDTGRFGMAGHSMGGGASLLAAAADGRIKAIVTLAPAETWPDSAIAAAADIHVPICYIVGSHDTFTPLETNAQPMYDNSNPPRELILLDGGYHSGFIDPDLNLRYDAGAMDHQLQLDLTWERMVGFFDTYLKNDPLARPQLRNSTATLSDPILITVDK